MAKRRNVEVPISLLKLSTEQFAYSIDNLPADNNKAELVMNNSIRFGLDSANEIVGCIFKFELCGKNDKVVLVVEAGAHFAVEASAFVKLLNKKKKTFTIPMAAACHMLSISIGAARGILHAKTEGTEINGLHIPLLNTESLIPEDIIIETADTSKLE